MSLCLRLRLRQLMVLVLGLGFFIPAWCRSQEAPLSAEDAQLLQKVVERGVNYLSTKGQAADGTFTKEAGSGLTSLAVTAMLRNGRPVDDPAVAKGLKALEGFVQPDGGIYSGGRLKNYETCVAMLCFSEANTDGRYNESLKRAGEFLRGIQYGPANNREADDPWYGGVGYSGTGRPDLSNTAYFIEALRAAESSGNDRAIQRAIVFISRCQNLEGPHNDTRFAGRVNDGGFYYEIPLEDLDPAKAPERITENGGLRSYGSMSYTGLKSMIFAGLTADDPRVKAAVKWMQQHYAVDKNPGMGSAGLYYYYHTFGAALKAAGIEQLEDAAGRKHDWKHDLITELASRQQADGSWSNENTRWFENDRNLATSFALMALAYCQPPKLESKATATSEKKK